MLINQGSLKLEEFDLKIQFEENNLTMIHTVQYKMMRSKNLTFLGSVVLPQLRFAVRKQEADGEDARALADRYGLSVFLPSPLPRAFFLGVRLLFVCVCVQVPLCSC